MERSLAVARRGSENLYNKHPAQVRCLGPTEHRTRIRHKIAGGSAQQSLSGLQPGAQHRLVVARKSLPRERRGMISTPGRIFTGAEEEIRRGGLDGT
jgi:hypothetical protein